MMNFRGELIGIVIGAITSVIIALTIALSIWGNNSIPSWYAFPCIIIGGTGGVLGAYIGEKKL